MFGMDSVRQEFSGMELYMSAYSVCPLIGADVFLKWG